MNYDLWLGPASKRPFNSRRFHGTWRQFREYGNGDFGDDGAHDVDMARWGLGVQTHPVRITGHGSNVVPPGYSEFPDNMTVTFEYADGRVLIYEDRLFTPYGQLGVDSGNAFYGTEGYMIFSRRGFFRTYLGGQEEPGPASGKSGRVGLPVLSHWDGFLEAVRARTQPSAGIEVAHLSSGLVHLGEIAFRTRSVLEFDPETETITNHPAANDMLTKEYRRHPIPFPRRPSAVSSEQVSICRFPLPFGERARVRGAVGDHSNALTLTLSRKRERGLSDTRSRSVRRAGTDRRAGTETSRHQTVPCRKRFGQHLDSHSLA